MSLMNDMLRDLEKRQAPDRTQQIEAQGYGALTQKTENHSSRAVILLLGIIIVMLVVLAVGWWHIQTTPQVNNESEISKDLLIKTNDPSEGVVVGRVDRSPELTLIVETSQANTADQPLVNNATQANVASAPSSDNVPKAQTERTVESEVVSYEMSSQASTTSQEGVIVENAVVENTIVEDVVVEGVVVEDTIVEDVVAESVSTPSPSKKSVVTAPIQKVDTKVVAAAEASSKKAVETERKATTAKSVTVDQPKSEVGAISKVLVVSPEQRDEQMADSAEALINKGSRQNAKTQLMTFIDQYETDVKSRALLVSLLMQDGHMGAANALLTNEKVAESSHLRRLKAHWLTQNGQTDEAVALLNSARPDIESDPEYHVLLAALYQQQGFSSEAVATYAELLSYNPKVADWWAGMAIALDSSQQYPSAKKAYQKALQMEGLRFELADFAKQRLATLGG